MKYEEIKSYGLYTATKEGEKTVSVPVVMECKEEVAAVTQEMANLRDEGFSTTYKEIDAEEYFISMQEVLVDCLNIATKHFMDEPVDILKTLIIVTEVKPVIDSVCDFMRRMIGSGEVTTFNITESMQKVLKDNNVYDFFLHKYENYREFAESELKVNK
jgi:hypothetical protein